MSKFNRIHKPAGLALLAVMIFGFFSQPAYAQNPAAAQIFYAPIKEDQLLDLLRGTSGAGQPFPVTPMHAVLSMVASKNATWIYYDHWEVAP